MRFQHLFSRFFFSLLILGAVLNACKHEVEPPAAGSGGTGSTGGGSGTGSPGGTGSGGGIPCDSTKVYFRQQVLPILLSNCAMSGCHDDISRQDGVVLTSYEKVMSTGDIRPGRPGDSDLYEVLVESDPSKRMPRPPQAPLTAAQIKLIRDWIQQGALDLSCSSNCDSSRFSYAAVIQPIIRNKCQGCHSGATPQGGIDLGSYNAVKARVTDGKLWGAVSHQPGYAPMPKNGNKLSDCELTQIRNWIQGGSPNN